MHSQQLRLARGTVRFNGLDFAIKTAGIELQSICSEFDSEVLNLTSH